MWSVCFLCADSVKKCYQSQRSCSEVAGVTSQLWVVASTEPFLKICSHQSKDEARGSAEGSMRFQKFLIYFLNLI